MREVKQKLLDLGLNESFDENDYFVSKSNFFAKKIIETWPKWEKKIINIVFIIDYMINSLSIETT